MQKFIINIVISLCLVVTGSFQLVAQGTSPVGVNFIIVNFNQPPTTLSVYKAPLKYNKDFAFSMQVDDANLTLLTHGFPVFEGGVVNGTTYPGFFYSDGCGNAHSFKMSSSVFVFNSDGENGPDTHIDNSYNQLTWVQLDTVYNHNWGILNHGVNGNKNPDPFFMDYSIKRNRSYIRRKMYTTIPGGVITHAFVNPGGSSSWTIPAFDLGNICALNQNETFPLGVNGGDVNNPAVNWTQKYSLLRRTADDVVVPTFVDGLANSSVGGSNYWSSIFTHSLITQYSFSSFVSDFNYVAGTYGINGLDNILMSTDEEILDYLIVRDATTLNHVINGTSLLITYSGEVPDDLRYFSSTIVVESDATISNIIIDGTDDYTYTGIGNSNALLNLNWDGYYVIPPEYYADSMVTTASTSQTQYNCWIAMDYVVTLDNGFHKDSLRQILCDIPNMVYDAGFCNCEINLQPADTTINYGECIDLFGVDGEYDYEWYVGDSLVDTIQNIFTCPLDTTQYNLVATNTFGCPAEDSIMVNVRFLSFDLGPDTTICEGNCVIIEGPSDMVQYNWYVADTIFDTVQSIAPCPIDTTQYTLVVIDTLGATAEDSIVINVLPSPVVNLHPRDSTIAESSCIELFSAEGEGYIYVWSVGDSTLADTTYSIFTCPAVDSTQYNIAITNSYNCSAKDSTMVFIEYLSFNLGPNQTICDNSCTTIEGPPDMIEYTWYVADTIFDTVQIITPCPIDTTIYTLFVEDIYGATASDSIIINTRTTPTVSFEEDTLYVSLGDNIMLNVISSSTFGSLYKWIYNGDTTAFAVNDYYNLINPTVSAYVYVIMEDEYACTATDSAYLSVLGYPQIIVSNDTAICSKQPLELTVSGGDLFLWIVENDTISMESTILVYPEVSTNYIAQTAYANSSNYSVDTVKVTIFNSTQTEILYDTNTVCTYVDIELAAFGANHYLWIPGEDTTEFYTFTIYDTITIYLIGTNDDGCQSIDSVMFYNKPPPEVNFTGLFPVFCDNDSWVQLTGTPTGGIYSGEGIVGDKFYPQISDTGIHNIVYTVVNSENCVGFDTNTTIVYGNGGSIGLGPNFTLDYDSVKLLDAGLGFDSYFWTTGQTSQSIVVRGNDNSPGIYEYAVMGVINGCSSRGSVNITFVGTDGYFDNHIVDLTIFPNPNNGSFTINFSSVEKDVKLGIYSPQGKLIYELQNIDCIDDCKINVQLKNVYPGFYIIRITTSAGVSTAKIIFK